MPKYERRSSSHETCKFPDKAYHVSPDCCALCNADLYIALRPTMTHALRIMCLYASFFAFTPICSGYLQAMGRPNRSVGCALWRNAVLITFFSIFSSIMGLDGIFWALLCGHMVGAVTIFTVSQITQRRLTTPIEPDSRIA